MKKIEKIVIASKNPAKVKRFRNILSKYAKNVISLSDLRITDKPEENGLTAEENAKIKGVFYSQKTGLPVFCEDEALYVDFLPKSKQPGVYIRRVNGKDELDDDQLLSHWEKIIVKVPEEKRTGYMNFAYCLAKPDGILKTFTFDRSIIFFSPTSKVRIPGWPMSSLEGPLEFGKPHSELTQEERKKLDSKTNKEIAKMIKKLFK